jgi:hypothetical protein
MPKKGELKPMDVFEESIRENAVAYNVVFFQPGQSSRVYQTFNDLNLAIKYSAVTLSEPNRIRTGMIYAIDKENHHALVGTMNRDGVFKKVEPKRY